MTQRESKEFNIKGKAWKGEKAGYVAKHSWLAKYYKKTGKCQKCGTTKSKRTEWANISGKYLRTINDYIELCPSCHRRLDYGDTCKHGHKLLDKNIRINKNGWRICLSCEKIHNTLIAIKRKQQRYKKKHKNPDLLTTYNK